MTTPTFFSNRTAVSSGPLMMRLTFIDDAEERVGLVMLRADAVAMANAVLSVESQMNMVQMPVVGGEQ